MEWTTGDPDNSASSEDSTFYQHYNDTINVTIFEDTPYIPYSKRPETYIVPIIFFLILIVGVTGNAILVFTILRHSNMRNVPNTYVLSLALGDLLVIATCVPFTSTIYTLDSWPFGLLLCKLSECAKDISIGVSVFTLTALSVDRFFAIVNPMRKFNAKGRGRRATRFTTVTAGLIWLLAIGLAFPATFSYLKPIQVNKEVSFVACYPFPDEFGPSYPQYVLVARFFIYYAIPLCVIGIFYALMARYLVQSTKNIPGEMQGQIKQVKARKKVARMVLAFVAVFAICFFPQHVYMLWFYFHPTAIEDYNGFWHVFRILGFCLSFMNSCINPIALYFVSGTFRKYFNRYLLCQCESKTRRTRLSIESNKRGRSFSASSRRKPSAKKIAGRNSRSRQSVVHLTRWTVQIETGGTGSANAFIPSEQDQQQQQQPQQQQQQQQQEQETSVSIDNNGHERRV